MTPSDFKRHSFQPMGKGTYLASEVDDYMDKAAASFEQVYFDKQELVKKISILADRIEEYRQDEDNIKITLLNAQRMANRILKEANANAQAVIDEAAGKAEAAAAKVRNDADAYAAGKTAEADEYLAKATDEYETKTAAVNAYAADVVNDADKKAEYIISDAKIKAAAAVEKANADLAALEENAAALTERAQKKLDSIKSLTLQYKHEILDIVDKHKTLLDSLSFDDMAFEAQAPDADAYKKVSSSEDDSADVAPKKADLDAILAEYQSKVALSKPAADIKADAEKPAEEVVEPTEDTSADEHAGDSFIDVSSNYVPPKKISSVFNMTPMAEPSRPEPPVVNEVEEPQQSDAPAKAISFEEAEAQPDFLEMLQSQTRKRTAVKSVDDDDYPDDDDYDDNTRSGDGYTQPSLFDGMGRTAKFKEKMSSYDEDDDYDDDYDEKPRSGSKNNDDLEFGSDFDIFDGDDSIDSSFFGKFKKKK